MIAAALIVLAAAIAFAAWRCFEPVPDILAERRARRVLVTLKSGEAFSGVLYQSDADVVVLRDAHAVAFGPRSENVPVDGEALLLRADIAYLQLP